MQRWMILMVLSAVMQLGAKVQLIEFTNESQLDFGQTFCDGTPIQGAILDQPNSCMTESAGDLQIILEDAGPSKLGDLQCKLHIWLESDQGFPLFQQDRILYATVFYEGNAEVSLHLDRWQKLHIIGKVNVQSILYPWADDRPFPPP